MPNPLYDPAPQASNLALPAEMPVVQQPVAAAAPKPIEQKPTHISNHLTVEDAHNALQSGELKLAPTFYHTVEHAIRGSKQNKASLSQWINTLKNQPGIKQEELDWLQLHRIGDQNKHITKQDLERFVADNKVSLNEVIKTGAPAYSNATEGWMGAVRQATASQTPRNPPKYEKYQLPGGEPGSYKEMLLTLPEGGEIKKRYDQIQNRLDQISKLPAAETNPKTEKGKEYLKEWDNLNAERSKLVDKLPQPYKSSHWDEPNVLVHMRMNDRNIEGQKALHIEEIQSDWHQAGREQGYKVKNYEIIPEIKDGIEGYRVGDEWFASKEHAESMVDKIKQGVPDAPFKKTWADLALKRAIRYAAENGYDAVSWTPGQAQADRYDLEKHISKLNVGKSNNPNFPYHLTAYDKGMNTVFNQDLTNLDELHGIVGREVGDKLKEKASKLEKPGQSADLGGVDLRVGGEGMKEFYDKMIPAKANALIKKFGSRVENKLVEGNHDASLNEPFESRDKAVDILKRGGEIYAQNKYGQEELVTSVKELEELEKEDGPFRGYILGDRQPKQPVHFFKITPELRYAALAKGFPMFGGLTTSAVEGNPFEAKK